MQSAFLRHRRNKAPSDRYVANYMAARQRIRLAWVMSIQNVVGENVRRYRLLAGLSQEQLAARLEAETPDRSVDQAYISRLENGRWNVTIGTLWNVANVLGVRIGLLVEPDRDDQSG